MTHASSPSQTLIWATAAATLLLAAAPARADCRLSIQPAQDQWRVEYDPFAQDEAGRSFDLALVNQGDSACSGNLSVDLRGEQFGLSQPGDSQRIPYALVDDSGGTDLTPRAGQSARRLNARPVSLAPGERSLARFTFAAAPNDRVSQGTYSQDAFISVETADGMPLAEKGVTLAIFVPRVAVMGLAGAFRRVKGTATIDLGELVAGSKSLDTSLYVASTGGYVVRVSSANNGVLKRDSGDWAVGYGLSVGTQSIDLAQAGNVTRAPQLLGRFDGYPLSINLENVTGLRAGNYSDTVTFTVEAN